jgi:hypothetical protein
MVQRFNGCPPQTSSATSDRVVMPRPFNLDPSWHKDGMDYVITFDVGLFAEAGIRKLEDYLLVHAAFAREWPDVSE